MHKSFSFKGMTRSSDNLLATEGECLELVNLRYVNGSLRPIPKFKNEAELPAGYSKIFWHEMAECYICVTGDGKGGLCFYDKKWNRMLSADGKVLEFPELSGVCSVEFVGYLVSCISATGIYFILYDGGSYRWLGERPPVPQLEISLSPKLHEVATDTPFSPDTSATNLESSWRYNEKGYCDECISYLNKKGYYIDRTLFRFALRLFDGSYIYCSNVIYAGNDYVEDGVGRDGDNLQAEPVDASSNMLYYKVKVLGFKPEFRFSNLSLKDWDGVVVGIDLFSVGSIMGKKCDSFLITLHSEESSVHPREMIEAYVEKELDELWNDIDRASHFYKVAEFDLTGKCINSIDDVSMENLALQQSLNGAEFPHSLNSVAAGCSYTLNNRLHVGNLREWFYKGYDASALRPVTGSYKMAGSVIVETKIKTKNSTAIVVKDYGSIELGYRNGLYELPPILAYPDARAYEMNIIVDTGTSRLMKSFPLNAHIMLNCAQYLHKWYLGHIVTVESQFASGGSAAYVSPEDVLEIFSEQVGVHEVVYSSSLEGWTYNGRLFPPEEYSSLRVFAIPRNVADGDKILFKIEYGVNDTSFKDINNIPVDSTWTVVDDSFSFEEKTPYEERPNIVKVSLVDNPFIFPAQSTYSPSQGKVVGMASNSVALSQGQFGEHPLYMFCDNGIWAMSVDTSGTLAYSNSFPVSREACLGNSLLLGIDSGVVFLGNKGVMLLSGSRINCISSSMDGDESSGMQYAGSDFMLKMLPIFFPLGITAVVGFMGCMRSAVASYLPRTGELLFVNPLFNFCYIYSLAHGTWGKVSGKVSGVIAAYPVSKLFAVDNNVTKIMSVPNVIAGANSVLLHTRPLLWGTKLPKRVMQLMLHACICLPDTQDASLLFGCYLLCSNDGVNFRFVSGSEVNKERVDIAFPYHPTQSYKYFALAMVGSVGGESSITGAEFQIALAWNNRLR